MNNNFVPEGWQAHRNAAFDFVWINGDSQSLTASGDQTVALWDLERTTRITTFTGHTCSVRSVASCPDNPGKYAMQFMLTPVPPPPPPSWLPVIWKVPLECESPAVILDQLIDGIAYNPLSYGGSKQNGHWLDPTDKHDVKSMGRFKFDAITWVWSFYFDLVYACDRYFELDDFCQVDGQSSWNWKHWPCPGVIWSYL